MMIVNWIFLLKYEQRIYQSAPRLGSLQGKTRMYFSVPFIGVG
ncbi:MAG: hypothetical protein RL275_968 [Chloroflexota bacterium]|jgi:hypothetical protein